MHMGEALEQLEVVELARPIAVGLCVGGEMIEEGVWLIGVDDSGCVVRTSQRVEAGEGVTVCIRGLRDEDFRHGATVASCAGDPQGGFKAHLGFDHAIDSRTLVREIGL